MDAIDSLPNDPLELVRRLDAEIISKRIDDLDRERAALMVLLRAARRTHRDDAPMRREGEGAR